jgi:hypothetical protein
MSSDNCRPERMLLAEGAFCRIESCECGTFHVSLGPITLRLRPDVVESVWSTLGEALMRFGRAKPHTHVPPFERNRLS